MNTQLLVFDLDGTLIDTMGDYADKAAALIFEYYGTPRAEARRRYFDTSGLPFEKQLELMFPRLPCNTKVAEMFESWKDGYLLNVSLSSETEKLLRGWRNGGVRIAISSNNLEPYVQRLTRYWPVDIALGYRSKDRFGKGEPHFQKLEERFGFPRQRTLFIGDSPNDARISAQSKVPFWALLTDNFAEAEFSQYQPDAKFITQLSDLNASFNRDAAPAGDIGKMRPDRFGLRPKRDEKPPDASVHEGAVPWSRVWVALCTDVGATLIRRPGSTPPRAPHWSNQYFSTFKTSTISLHSSRLDAATRLTRSVKFFGAVRGVPSILATQPPASITKCAAAR